MPPVDLFDADARRVLALAQQEAVRFHHAFIASGHLLIALLLEGANSASRTMESTGVDIVQARASLVRLTPSGDATRELTEISLSAGAMSIIERAAAEAARMGSARVTSDHLALALSSEPEAETILLAVGLSPDALRRRIMTDRTN